MKIEMIDPFGSVGRLRRLGDQAPAPADYQTIDGPAGDPDPDVPDRPLYRPLAAAVEDTDPVDGWRVVLVSGTPTWLVALHDVAVGAGWGRERIVDTGRSYGSVVFCLPARIAAALARLDGQVHDLGDPDGPWRSRVDTGFVLRDGGLHPDDAYPMAARI